MSPTYYEPRPYLKEAIDWQRELKSQRPVTYCKGRHAKTRRRAQKAGRKAAR